MFKVTYGTCVLTKIFMNSPIRSLTICRAIFCLMTASASKIGIIMAYYTTILDHFKKHSTRIQFYHNNRIKKKFKFYFNKIKIDLAIDFIKRWQQIHSLIVE